MPHLGIPAAAHRQRMAQRIRNAPLTLVSRPDCEVAPVAKSWRLEAPAAPTFGAHSIFVVLGGWQDELRPIGHRSYVRGQSTSHDCSLNGMNSGCVS